MNKARSYLNALLLLLALFAFEVWRGGDWQRLLPWVGGSVVLVAFLVNREARRSRSSDCGGSSGGGGDGFGGGWSTGGGASGGWGDGSGGRGGDGGD